MMNLRSGALMQFVVLTSLSLSVACAQSTTARSAPPKVGESAREFSLLALDGAKVALSDLTKAGPVVLIVLRGWPGYQCPLCTRQVAELRSKADDFSKRDARVVLVYPGPADRLDENAREFMKNEKLPEGFHFVTDPNYRFTNAYGLRWDAKNETAYPSTFVIGKDNVVRYAKVSKTHGDRAPTDDVLKALDEIAE